MTGVQQSRPGEWVLREGSHRHCLEVALAEGYAGSVCSLLVRRMPGRPKYRIQLLFHAVLQTGAAMTEAQARELADALIKATDADG